MENNSTIWWTVIYLADRVSHILNKWALVFCMTLLCALYMYSKEEKIM